MFHRTRHFRARSRFVRRLRRRPAPPLMVTVYLSTDPHSMIYGYRPGDTFLLADRFLLDNPGHTGGIDDCAVLERVFAALNDHPRHDDIDHTRRWYRRGHRSLSVGDVVGLGPRHYACTAVGWRHVPPPG
ncbi:hypothetical protein ACFU44_17420 [Nocardia rhizosphaerihabitans]|uniref:hypothetical protein n=1 Tax=Nocardia rhizosphaerihabitans TaxID=1691570 RepID=UPI00366B9F4B